MKPPHELPVQIYRPGSDLSHPLQLFQQLCQDAARSRGLSWQLFVRDFKAQYRQSLLGYLWAVLPPLVNASVFIFLNKTGAINIRDTGVPYPLFVVSGTMLWQSFVEAVAQPGNAIRSAIPMLSKINFPREAIILSAVGMLAVNTLVRLAIITVFLLIYGATPNHLIVWFPLAFGGLILFGLGIGIVLGLIGSLYTDIARGLPLVTQLLMYATPVIYPARDEGILGTLAKWNPVSPFILSGRAALLGEETLPLLHLLAWYVPGSALLFLVAWIAYRVVMPRLIERMPS